MNDTERRAAAKAFAEYWKDRGYEKGESQPFWLSLLRDVLGVESPEKFITFEEQVRLDHTSFIDGFISATHVLIEQKGRNKDLRKPIKQSDGTLLTPFQQAQRYSAVLPYSQRPRWIITCNFEEFLVYDMEKPNGEPEQIFVKDLAKEYYRLMFLVDTGDDNIRREMEVSIQAGNLVGILYDEILKQYHDPENEESLKSLNKLIVRLVFCLYAEDAGIFGGHSKFHNYIKSFSARDMRKALIELFKILDTKPDDRDPYEDEQLSAFPYVNGGLFADENIEIPQMNDTIRDLLLRNASENFDWSDISPTIFGAVFESTLNPETRRSGGMHYTSIENIHKVIDPLFLDELREELEEIKAIKVAKTRETKINAFREKLGNLTFFDPACGSGNFLTETYISLRRLENEALEEITKGQIVFDFGDVIHVSIAQFYGIEINDFAVTVAKTALWIAESQMMKETEDIVHQNLEFLPLKTNAHIVEGNALRTDWETVAPKDKLNYIMGNPPFVGARLMTKEQKDDVVSVFGVKWKNAGNLDYVSCWYKKATDLMKGTNIRTALVSTNSVSQGESVAILWKPLFEDGVHIDFAHRTFRWDSEASIKAHVHCVIIGFSIAPFYKSKVIFSAERPLIVDNINAYLIDAPDVFIESVKKTVCDVPQLVFGSMPNDNGFLSNYSQEERDAIVAEYPESEIVFKQFVGATEFINNKIRWCMWLKGVSPNIIRNTPPIAKAVASVKEMREQSNREATKKLAETPTLFGEIRQPSADYIVIPRVSSERRKYIPIGFLNADYIASDAVQILPDANMFHFGVLTSNVHMAWMRAVCGRLKSDYRYSVNIVYNNFPWPTPTDEQKADIEKTAQTILDARAKYPDCSLADLYDEVAMPPELRKAHQENDKAVMRAYDFWGKLNTESECVAELMKMYQELTSRDR
ncbi:MAG: class I SAM-dependent DNA methyltransferase [Ruminococcaceae bacterium]|nr:class I SAM-dependent DNA methyltransferase [Oscillospiraceae bacterium]